MGACGGHFADRSAELNVVFSQGDPLFVRLSRHSNHASMWVLHCCVVLVLVAPSLSRPYDPKDDQLKKVLPSTGEFEAFYPKEAHGVPNGSSRPAHGHGSFYKYRNPALVDVKNAAAYGFRFDGMRRFNFDEE